MSEAPFLVQAPFLNKVGFWEYTQGTPTGEKSWTTTSFTAAFWEEGREEDGAYGYKLKLPTADRSPSASHAHAAKQPAYTTYLLRAESST